MNEEQLIIVYILLLYLDRYGDSIVLGLTGLTHLTPTERSNS